MTSERVEKIRNRLLAGIQAESIEIVDDSQKHKDHEGAKAGGGHFKVTIVAKAFTNKTIIQRHRIVYEALGEMMHRDIHALSIKALTPEEL